MARQRGSRGKREQDADGIPPAIRPLYPGIEMRLFSSGRLKAEEFAEPPRVLGGSSILHEGAGLK